MLITKVNVDNNGLSGVSFEDFAPDLNVVDNTVKWSVLGLWIEMVNSGADL